MPQHLVANRVLRTGNLRLRKFGVGRKRISRGKPTCYGCAS